MCIQITMGAWAFARVRQAKPDLRKFPRLARALPHRLQLRLEEGEVLYIPACWAHEITGEPFAAKTRFSALRSRWTTSRPCM